MSARDGQLTGRKLPGPWVRRLRASAQLFDVVLDDEVGGAPPDWNAVQHENALFYGQHHPSPLCSQLHPCAKHRPTKTKPVSGSGISQLNMTPVRHLCWGFLDQGVLQQGWRAVQWPHL